MESIIGLYKTECVRPGPFHTGLFKTPSDVEYATMAWVDWFGPHRRRHATVQYAVANAMGKQSCMTCRLSCANMRVCVLLVPTAGHAPDL
jgi:hypothetical protein